MERLLQYVGIYGNILWEWLLKSCVDVQWIYLPNGSAHWRVIANAVLNLRVPPHKVGCRRSRKSCDASSDTSQPSTCHHTCVGAGWVGGPVAMRAVSGVSDLSNAADLNVWSRLYLLSSAKAVTPYRLRIRLLPTLLLQHNPPVQHQFILLQSLPSFLPSFHHHSVLHVASLPRLLPSLL